VSDLYGCIEAGGTKFVVGVARSETEILATERVPTTTPAETMAAVRAFFDRAGRDFGDFAAFGIGSFGPVGLDRNSANWGHILDTPKPGWSGTDIGGEIARAYGRPVGFDTDVNAAALAEVEWGAAIGASIATYVTVGTGIGGGVVIDGRPLHGHRHPEMGHALPQRHPNDTAFAGHCPFHGACYEGLASGPAILAHWGKTLSDLPPEHEAHEITAFYLAQLVVTQQAMLSPERIVLGGGVMDTPGLLARVRARAATLANGYFSIADDGYETLVQPPSLGNRAGLLGALLLAQQAHAAHRR
jgi:fructokinase